jgi:hypothetical protein
MERLRIFLSAALSAVLVLLAPPAISNDEVTQRSFFPADFAEKAIIEIGAVASISVPDGVGSISRGELKLADR